jgi:benzoyl-CoA reductase subunit B
LQQEQIKKDASMIKEKEILSQYYHDLLHAKEQDRKIIYTFVPGNITELIRVFDAISVYPEILSLQAGMRRISDEKIRISEEAGHSEDVCTYVKCHLGMILQQNIGPTGITIPAPDLLLLSYTGCFTFIKWFEILKKMFPDVPVVMVHVPYQADGVITDKMREYLVEQLKSEYIPLMEKLTGKKYDEERIKEMMKLSAKAEQDLVAIFQSAKHKPSPIDAFFGGVYYIGPIFNGFRGTQEACDFYKFLRQEVDDRVSKNLGPVGPVGEIQERFRIVVEGAQPWVRFRDNWKIFYDEGAVCVASTYTKVGGFYEWGFRHDPNRPLESMADYCMWCMANMSLVQRIELIEKYIKDLDADGFIVASIKSCNSYSAGQLVILNEVEKRTGLSGTFIEYDIVDSRYYALSNVKVRLESYFQMLDEKKRRQRKIN